MNTLEILLILFSLLLVFSIGSQDETMATTYGSGSLKLYQAIFLGSILGFLGVVFLSNGVGQTIGSNLLGMEEVKIEMILSIVIGTALWLLIAIRFGLPVSTTHTVVGAVFGVGIIWAIMPDGNISESLNWLQVGLVFLGWILSPLLGYYCAQFLQKPIELILMKKNKGLLEVEEIEKWLPIVKKNVEKYGHDP